MSGHDEPEPPPSIPALEEFARALSSRNQYRVEEALGIRRFLGGESASKLVSTPWPDYPPEGLLVGLDHPWLRARLRELVLCDDGAAGMKACDLLRAFPEERAGIEALVEARIERDVLVGLALVPHLLRGSDADRAWLARIVAVGRLVEVALEEMAPGPVHQSIIRAAKHAIAAKKLSRGSLDAATFWLARVEKANVLRGAGLAAFLEGLVAQAIIRSVDKKSLRAVPAAERTPERLLRLLVSPGESVDWRHASFDDWHEVAARLGVANDPAIATPGSARLFAIASEGDDAWAVMLTSGQATWLRAQGVELASPDALARY